MIENRVAEVCVRVRTDVSDVIEIRPAAERIVRAALERCAALIDEKNPGRIVLVRHLPLRWRLEESVLDEPAQVDELARAAADEIERILLPSSLEPPATPDGAVVFDDEPHLRASHLIALARGRPAWFHATLQSSSVGDPLVALAQPERRATAHAILVRLAREGVLAEVLAAWPAPAVTVLAAALGCDVQEVLSAQGESADGEAGTPTSTIGESTIVAELTAMASRWPGLAPPARSLALRVHAAVLLEVELEAPGAVALAAAVLDHYSSSPAQLDKRNDGKTAAEAAESTESTAFIATHCAGLFYLFDRVQELDLAESLWKACLPEGEVLAAAASALLGPSFAADPAPALFGGIDGVVACPPTTPEQQAEVAMATAAALAAALPRRRLAEIPPAVVSLVDHPAGRLLVASTEGSPFVFFAWPATTPEMLSTGLGALLDTWPHAGVLTASPALVTLDTSGRLRPLRDSRHAALLLPEAPSAPATALLALVVGAPCLLFAARAGAPELDTVEEFVARHLARPARIRVGFERMDVILSTDDLDLDARRAGLDRDPGWLPWLRRTVRFDFEEREPAANSPSAASIKGE